MQIQMLIRNNYNYLMFISKDNSLIIVEEKRDKRDVSV